MCTGLDDFYITMYKYQKENLNMTAVACTLASTIFGNMCQKIDKIVDILCKMC
jgi:hypothetical protein